MLTRFRIEVEGGDSAASTEEELTKYEHALQWMEATRYRCPRDGYEAPTPDSRWPGEALPGWHDAGVIERSFFNGELGREVTDEVIEYDPGLPGYRGRRVVRLRRVDTRWTAADIGDDPDFSVTRATGQPCANQCGPAEACSDCP